MDDFGSPMKPKEAAEYLGISRGSLYNLVYRGEITCYKPAGKLLYFCRKDLDAYIFRGKKTASFELNQEAERILNKGL